ncbi:MAG: hypothetical protein PHW73_04625 [Atribacterota bacterium]|nr:hypothetical protein [Atribacterota bacterium]
MAIDTNIWINRFKKFIIASPSISKLILREFFAELRPELTGGIARNIKTGIEKITLIICFVFSHNDFALVLKFSRNLFSCETSDIRFNGLHKKDRPGIRCNNASLLGKKTAIIKRLITNKPIKDAKGISTILFAFKKFNAIEPTQA